MNLGHLTRVTSAQIVPQCRNALRYRAVLLEKQVRERSCALVDHENAIRRTSNKMRRWFWLPQHPMMTYEEGLEKLQNTESVWTIDSDSWEHTRWEIDHRDLRWWEKVERLLTVAERNPPDTEHYIDGELYDFILKRQTT